ncbi:MAG: MarR family transcriptional regulator [Bacteroidota bacterium]
MTSKKSAIDPALEEVLFFQIDQCMRQAVRYTNRVFQEAGADLTKDQWLVLKKVNDEREHGVSPYNLAQLLGKEPASMTRILDILERKGLLERRPNPADRRSSLVFPSPTGEQLYQQLLPMVEKIREQAVTGFSATEVNRLRNYLGRMTENLR